MTEEEIKAALRRGLEAHGRAVRDRTPAWDAVALTPCLSLSRLDDIAVRDDAAPGEREHLATCFRCRRTVDLARKFPDIAEDPVPSPMVALPYGAEAVTQESLAIHKAEVRPLSTTRPPAWTLTARMRPETKQRVGAVARGEPKSATAAAGQDAESAIPVAARPLTGAMWALLTEDGKDRFLLPPEVAVRFHGNASLNKLMLWLRIVELGPDTVRLVLDVRPGPSRQAITFVVHFPDGQHARFVVAADPGSPRQLTSAPCEPVRRSALGLVGETPTLGEWSASVELLDEAGDPAVADVP